MSVEMKTLTFDDTTFLVMDKNLRTRIAGRMDQFDTLNIDQFPQYEVYGTCWLNLAATEITGNKPATSGQGVLITLEQSNNYARQVFIGTTTHIYKSRLYTKATSSWGSWGNMQIITKMGDLTQLTTTNKTSLVDAVNEVLTNSLWTDISDQLTNTSVITSGGLTAYYNPLLKMVNISGNATVSLSAGSNTLCNISSSYPPKAYYTGLSAMWEGNEFHSGIVARTQLRVYSPVAYTGNLMVAGSYILQ